MKAAIRCFCTCRGAADLPTLDSAAAIGYIPSGEGVALFFDWD